MRSFLRQAMATFAGVGFIPVAPGTAASLVVCLLYKFVLFHLSWWAYSGLFLLACVLGLAASTGESRKLGQDDPRRIVIDEVCGQLVALVAVSPGWEALGLSFLLFRFFDIVKPFPIRKTEKLPGGWGIMADDLLAGAMARLLLLLALPLWERVL